MERLGFAEQRKRTVNEINAKTEWTPLESRFLSASLYAAIFASALGAIGLIGWWRDLALFRTFSLPFFPFNPVGAACMLLCGLSVIFGQWRDTRFWSTAAKLLLLVVLVIGIGRLISLLSGSNSGLDLILSKEKIQAAQSLFLVRLPIEASVLFILCVSAIFCLNSGLRSLHLLSEWIIILALGSTLFTLAEYFYGTSFGTISESSSAMAFPAVFGFLALCPAILFSQPRRTRLMGLLASDTGGGRSARRLLPTATFVLFLVNYLPDWGAQKGWYEVRTANVLDMAGTLISVVAIILWNADSLRLKDEAIIAEHQDLEQKVQEQTRELSVANRHFQKLNRFYSELSKVNQVIVRNRNREQLLSEVCQIAVKDGLFQAAWVWLIDEKSQLLKPVAWAGVDFEYVDMIYKSRISAKEGVGPLALACRENRQIVVNDVATDPLMSQWSEEALSHGFRSLTVCPLKEGDQVVGGMGFNSKETQFFQSDELLLLEDLVGNISYALATIAQEQSLTESEQRFRTLFEVATDGIVLVDLETDGITMANPQMCGMLGYPLEDLVKMTIWDLHPAEELPFVRQGFPSVARGQNLDPVQLGVLRKNGSVFKAEVTGRVIQIGKQRMVMGIFRDITERMKTEQHIRILSKAVEHSPSIVILTDSEARIVYVNPKFTELTGFKPEEVIGQNPRILKGGDVAPETYREIWRVLTSGEIWRGEFHNRKKNGELYWADAAITALRNDAGEITHYLGVQECTTDRKKMEQERRMLEEQFRQAQKMEAVGRLAGGVAHDFNNLLGVISGYSELLLEDLHDIKVRQHLEEIQKAGKRATNLTRQLLAFSRKQIWEPKLLDLNSIISDMGKMLNRLIGEDVKVILAPAPNLGMVKADPGQVEQVILNLVVNSRDAMPTGGVLTIETSNTEMDEKIAISRAGVVAGKYVMLAISDTGAGMDAEILGHVFEPFFTTKKEGTGLGLATVYGIIKQCGGGIWVDSQPGRGTKVCVCLPQAGLDSQATTLPAVQKSAAGGTETILLVEDSQPLREVTRKFLERAGYAVMEASDGNKAVEEARAWKKPIHLLVTDVVMPGMNGRVVAEEVIRIHAETRVLYISGYTDDAIIQYGVLEDGVALLAKPFTRDALVQKVRQVLDT